MRIQQTIVQQTSTLRAHCPIGEGNKDQAVLAYIELVALVQSRCFKSVASENCLYYYYIVDFIPSVCWCQKVLYSVLHRNLLYFTKLDKWISISKYKNIRSLP